MKNKIDILLIEDNPEDSELVDLYLKKAFYDKYSLITANRLSKGFELLSQKNFDIVLLDLSLPDSHGIETFSQLFAAHSDIPIVVLTGFSNDTWGISAVKMGAQDFLDKNQLDGNVIYRAINYSIERHKLTRTIAEHTEKLILSEKRLKKSQQLAHIGNWEWNIPGNTLNWSDELYRIYGLLPQEIEVSYEVFLEYVYPDDKEYVKKIIEESLQTQHPFKFYYRIILSNKTVKTLYATGEVISDKNNNPLRMLGTGQDVTERLQAEKKFYTLLESAPDGVITVDEKGIISDWNRKAEDIFGWKWEEIIGMKLSEIIIPERYRQSYEKSMNRFIKTGEEPAMNRQLERSALKKDGTEFPVELTVSVIKLEDKHIFIGFIRDITERKIAQDVLKEKEELYRTVVESLSEGLIITDIDDKIIFANSEVENLTGYTIEEMTGKHAYKLFLSENQHKEFEERMIRRLSGIMESYELKITRKDGSYFWGNINAAPFRNSSGEIIGTVGAITDVTISKHEEELEKLVLAATQSSNSVVITDKNGKIEWVNEGFTKLSGYTLDDLKGTSGEILRGGSTPLFFKSAFYEAIIKEKKPFAYENKNYTKDGREYWVITTITPVLNESGEVERLISIDADITQRKHMEEELIVANRIAEHSIIKGNKTLDDLMKAKKQLEELVKMKEEFLANMSHEIRTPMNGILGLTNVLMKTNIDDEQKEYLSAIKTSGDTLMVVINDILDISKMEAGKMTFEETHFKISSITNSVIDLFHPKAKEKNIEMKIHIDDNIPEVLLGDPSRLNQVLMNLISNAVKFTQKGEILLTVQLKKEEEKHVLVEFSVKDTGIGIPEDKVNSIFLDFTQASLEINRRFGGTGLGLSISRKLVELQGGSIAVESKEKEGSNFKIMLRFKKCTGEIQLQDIPNEDEFMDRQLINTKILLVEDNPVNQLLAEKILKDWGCFVDTADNGKIAIEKLTYKTFDIILMDVKMPEMDGYQTTSHIRNKMASPVCDIPIVALTAHAATWEAEKCIRAGMNDYISKPFHAIDLFKKLAKYNIEYANSNTTESIESIEKVNLAQTSNQYINLTYLKKISKGSNEFMLKMINTFIKQVINDVSSMQQQLDEKDWDSLYNTAHKMKPSFIFMGIKNLKDPIISIERNARERANLETLQELISKVVFICDSSVKELEAEAKKLTNN